MKIGRRTGDFVQDEKGRFEFFPAPSYKFTARDLRRIAEEIDELNWNWVYEIGKG